MPSCVLHLVDYGVNTAPHMLVGMSTLDNLWGLKNAIEYKEDNISCLCRALKLFQLSNTLHNFGKNCRRVGNTGPYEGSESMMWTPTTYHTVRTTDATRSPYI